MCQQSKTAGSRNSRVMFAACLIIIFDLFILPLSTDSTYEKTIDTSAFNLSGRQRMLMERMTKTLMQIQTVCKADQYSYVLKPVARYSHNLAG